MKKNIKSTVGEGNNSREIQLFENNVNSIFKKIP